MLVGAGVSNGLKAYCRYGKGVGRVEYLFSSYPGVLRFRPDRQTRWCSVLSGVWLSQHVGTHTLLICFLTIRYLFPLLNSM